MLPHFIILIQILLLLLPGLLSLMLLLLLLLLLLVLLLLLQIPSIVNETRFFRIRCLSVTACPTHSKGTPRVRLNSRFSKSLPSKRGGTASPSSPQSVDACRLTLNVIIVPEQLPLGRAKLKRDQPRASGTCPGTVALAHPEMRGPFSPLLSSSPYKNPSAAHTAIPGRCLREYSELGGSPLRTIANEKRRAALGDARRNGTGRLNLPAQTGSPRL